MRRATERGRRMGCSHLPRCCARGHPAAYPVGIPWPTSPVCSTLVGQLGDPAPVAEVARREDPAVEQQRRREATGLRRARGGTSIARCSGRTARRGPVRRPFRGRRRAPCPRQEGRRVPDAVGVHLPGGSPLPAARVVQLGRARLGRPRARVHRRCSRCRRSHPRRAPSRRAAASRCDRGAAGHAPGGGPSSAAGSYSSAEPARRPVATVAAGHEHLPRAAASPCAPARGRSCSRWWSTRPLAGSYSSAVVRPMPSRSGPSGLPRRRSRPPPAPCRRAAASPCDRCGPGACSRWRSTAGCSGRRARRRPVGRSCAGLGRPPPAPAVGQQRRRVIPARPRQAPGRGPLGAGRVVQLGGGGCLRVIVVRHAAHHEDLPVQEQRGGVSGMGLDHLPGRVPRGRCWRGLR